MGSGSAPPGPRGDLSSVTDPAHFPSSFTALQKQTLPQKVIYNGTASGDTDTEPVEIGQCEGFAIYTHGTGNWNIQVSPNPNNDESFWIDLLASDKSGSGFYESQAFHPWVRVIVKDGANLIVWIYRKYATY